MKKEKRKARDTGKDNAVEAEKIGRGRQNGNRREKTETA